MAARGVAALELKEDLRGRVELALQVVGAHERRGAEGAVVIHNAARYGNVAVGIVELLFYGLLAEHGQKLLLRHGLEGARA